MSCGLGLASRPPLQQTLGITTVLRKGPVLCVGAVACSCAFFMSQFSHRKKPGHRQKWVLAQLIWSTPLAMLPWLTLCRESRSRSRGSLSGGAHPRDLAMAQSDHQPGFISALFVLRPQSNNLSSQSCGERPHHRELQREQPPRRSHGHSTLGTSRVVLEVGSCWPVSGCCLWSAIMPGAF